MLDFLAYKIGREGMGDYLSMLDAESGGRIVSRFGAIFLNADGLFD